jgi:hypothetical protein
LSSQTLAGEYCQYLQVVAKQFNLLTGISTNPYSKGTAKALKADILKFILQKVEAERYIKQYNTTPPKKISP